MTATKAATKRAERDRRRANGEVRCEVWLDAEVRARLCAGADRSGVSVSRALTMIINDTWPS